MARGVSGGVRRARVLGVAAFVVASIATGVASAQSPSGEAVAAPAEAEDEAAIAEARRRYAQGSEFFRRERYAEAVAEFTEAYSRWHNPTILYALAQAYEGLTQVTNAIRTYRLYLETAPPDDARRADVETRIAELERLLGTVRIESNVPADVYINGEREETSAPGVFRVPTGRHAIELRAEGYAPATQTVIVAAGTERTLTFRLAAIEERVEIVRVERERRRLPRPVFWTALGATGAFAAGFATVGGIALHHRNEYNATPDRNPYQRSDVQQWNRRADVLLGITGGLAVGTLIVGLLTDWDRSDDEGAPTASPAPTAGLELSNGGFMLSLGWVR